MAKAKNTTVAATAEDILRAYLEAQAAAAAAALAALGGEAAAPAAKGKAAAKPEPEPEVEEDEDDEESEYTRDDLEGLTLTALRKIAKEEYELSAADIKGLDKDGLIDLLLDEDGDEDDEDEDDEDEDDDESEDDGRAALEAMSVKELRKLAVQRGFDKDDAKDADKDSLVESIWEDMQEEGDEDDEEDEDDDEGEGYTEDDLSDMSLGDLKEIAEAWDLKVKVGTKKPGYIKAILKAQD